MLNGLPVPHYQQLADGYCLPACIQMVLAYLGIKRSQAALARALGTVSGAGTPGSRVKQLASQNLAITYDSGDLKTLNAMLERNIPPVLLVYTHELPYWSLSTAHAVVLCTIADEVAIVNDPAMPEPFVPVNLGDLMLAWDAMSNLYISLHKT